MEARRRGKGKDGGAGNAILECDAPGAAVPHLRLWRVFMLWVCGGLCYLVLLKQQEGRYRGLQNEQQEPSAQTKGFALFSGC